MTQSIVEQFMTAKVRTIAPDAPLTQAHHVLREHAFSCLPVVDGDRLVGVISRTDLLRLGQPQRRASARTPLLSLPDQPVSAVMRPDPACVTPQTTVAAASALLVARHFHRVFVTHEQKLVGVFSTRDAMDALQARKTRTPISDFMSTPVLSVESSSTVEHATSLLANDGVSGLVVLEDGFPVGLFTQVEALQAAAEPASTPVDEAMSYALLCLDLKTPLHRAAAQARATRARRVIAVEHRHVWGILTGIDFARAASSLPLVNDFFGRSHPAHRRPSSRHRLGPVRSYGARSTGISPSTSTPSGPGLTRSARNLTPASAALRASAANAGSWASLGLTKHASPRCTTNSAVARPPPLASDASSRRCFAARSLTESGKYAPPSGYTRWQFFTSIWCAPRAVFTSKSTRDPSPIATSAA